MGDDELPSTLKKRFQDVWSVRVMNYGERTGKFKALLKEMNTAIDSGLAESGKGCVCGLNVFNLFLGVVVRRKHSLYN